MNVQSEKQFRASFQLSHTFHWPSPSTIHVYWLATDDDSALFYSSWRQRTRFQWGKKWVTLFHHAYLTIQNSRTFSMLSFLYSHYYIAIKSTSDKMHVLHYRMLLYSFIIVNISTISYVILDVRESSKNF